MAAQQGNREMNDREYYKLRAEAERQAAMRAADPAAARAHFDLAREYEWRFQTEPHPGQDSAAEPSPV